MSDLHVICNENWLDEIIYCLELIQKTMNDLYLLEDLKFIIRYQKDFNKNIIKIICKKVVDLFGINLTIHEILETQQTSWIFKFEFVINVKNDIVQLSTIQIDTSNSEVCDIYYYNTALSQKERPVILHVSPLGSIERIIHVLIHKPIPYNLRKLQLAVLDFNKQLPKVELSELNKLKGLFELDDYTMLKYRFTTKL